MSGFSRRSTSTTNGYFVMSPLWKRIDLPRRRWTASCRFANEPIGVADQLPTSFTRFRVTKLSIPTTSWPRRRRCSASGQPE